MLEDISFLSKKSLKKIQKIISPLESLGVTYFARQTVSYTGEWEILGNLPDWLDFSAENEFYKVDPSLLSPNYYQSGLIVNSSSNVPDFLKKFTTSFRNMYQMDHTLCIFQKTLTGGEWYFFAAEAENYKALSTYITQIKTIYQFINYFKNEAELLIKKNLEHKINIAQLKNLPFDAMEQTIELLPFKLDDKELISLHGNIHISPREKDCLIYLCQGKTIKETAKILGLSPRTIEDYINTLKRKTGCKYKRQLLAIFQTNNQSRV